MNLGMYRSSGEHYQGGCSCLVIAFVVTVLVAIGLFALGIHATNLMEEAWQK